jgi:azurin
VGPDGAVWVIDWYNYIVQHNPTPKNFQTGEGNAYENKLRDQRFGRIYRIVWKDGKPSPQPDLTNPTPATLVATLSNENLLWRRHAQRLLVERGRKDVVPALIAVVRNAHVDEIGLNVGAIHALWTLSGLNALDSDPTALAAATEALHHPSAGVRRTAAMVLPRSMANGLAIVKASLLEDPDGQVRLAALLALAESPDIPEAGRALRAAVAKPNIVADRWALDAAKMAATAQQTSFLSGVGASDLAAAQRTEATAMKNLLANGSFENANGFMPAGWEMGSLRGGTIEVELANVGHTGAHAVKLSAKEPSSGDLITKQRVKPATRYELSGWIKPDPVRPIDAAQGALLSVVQLQGAGQRFNSNAVRGSRDWAPVKVAFESGTSDEVSIACILGGGGMATGSALFNDLSLVDLGPSDGTIYDPLTSVLAHLGRRTSSSKEAAATGAANVMNEPMRIVLSLGVIPDVMKYDTPELRVKAGVAAKIVFKNNDHMQHNVLVLRPGSIDAVGTLADQMLTDPQAIAKNFVPLTGDVLFNTPLVNPGETFELNFTAPTQPGRYPFVCTFPGHWRIMQGTLIVTAP